uniref:Uncharacterized protein n=1 Tax=Rhizophora mucronata TaxID=61149 RepID=A0A2P2P5H0_RHIMU
MTFRVWKPIYIKRGRKSRNLKDGRVWIAAASTRRLNLTKTKILNSLFLALIWIVAWRERKITSSENLILCMTLASRE